MYARDAQGRIYAWGDNSNSALGIDTGYQTMVSAPRRVEGALLNRDIRYISPTIHQR